MDALLMETTNKTPRFSLDGLVVRAKCVDVHDGDTAQFTFQPYAGASISRFTIRFAGYNSAEIKGETAQEREKAAAAKKYLEDLILNKIVALNLYKYDKYGRLLADVFVDQEGIKLHVNSRMVDTGHGKPYDGKGAKTW